MDDPGHAEALNASPTPCRPFNLGDMMILLAAIACGLAFALRTLRVLGQVGNVWLSPPRPITDPIMFVEMRRLFIIKVIVGLEQFFLPWLAASAIIRLRRPRPVIRQLARQPGALAVAIVAAGFLLSLLMPISGNINRAQPLMILSAASVLTAWAALALTGTWRKEPGWVDRLGRALGIFFSLAVVAQFLLISLP